MKLEAYLTRATRGLWGRKRREVIAELRGSLEARAWRLECQGYSPERAIQTALLEMGAAQHISAGFLRTHTMPNISKIGFAAIALVALGVATIPSSQAQVGWVVPHLTLSHDKMIVNCLCGNLYISLDDLKTSLEKAGANIFGSRNITLWCSLGFSGCTMFLGLTPSVVFLVAALFFWGASNAGLDVAMNTQGTTVEEGFKRPVLSSFHAMWSVGSLAGAAVGGVLAGSGLIASLHLISSGLIPRCLRRFSRDSWLEIFMLHSRI